jgi:hypothetical protein
MDLPVILSPLLSMAKYLSEGRTKLTFLVEPAPQDDGANVYETDAFSFFERLRVRLSRF